MTKKYFLLLRFVVKSPLMARPDQAVEISGIFKAETIEDAYTMAKKTLPPNSKNIMLVNASMLENAGDEVLTTERGIVKH